MYEIHVVESFDAPIETVFDVLSDHERLLRGPGIESCEVTTRGREKKNGLGAIREIHAGAAHFVEEVVRFERPRRYDYRITKLSMRGVTVPNGHELGWLELVERDGRVRVDWRSRFSVRIPLLGGLLEPRIGRQFAKQFSALLVQAKGDITRAAEDNTAT
jgi:hypothetical protein